MARFTGNIRRIGYGVARWPVILSSCVLLFAPTARATLPEGAKAPVLTVDTTKGRTWESRTGRATLVLFGATWSRPCRSAIPILQTLSRKYGRMGLAVIVVSLGEGRRTPQEYRRRNGIACTFGWTDERQARALSRQFDFSGIPTTYILDKKGIIRYADTGFPSTSRERQERIARMEQVIRQVLAQK